MAAKSYLDLKSEVWDAGRCSGCGACVAVCPADALYFDLGSTVEAPRSSGYCKQVSDSVTCGACYSVCPRIGNQPQETLGIYTRLITAKAGVRHPQETERGSCDRHRCKRTR